MSSTKQKLRLAYLKPELFVIALLSEVVLAACKTRGGLRSLGFRCDNLQGKCVNRTQGS